MNTAVARHSVSLARARCYIENLDLSYIIKAMCSPSYPLPQWTEADALHCAKLYKNYLLLQKMHPSVNLVPTKEIDEFWHNHILYTQQYFYDCEHIFGHYLHHAPANPDEEAAQLVAGFLRTKELYQAAFGEPLIRFSPSSVIES